MSGLCTRCRSTHTSFRVKTVYSWKPVCRDCIEQGDLVYINLPDGELVGDVAPEINQ